jgi:hypothetical protein
MAWKCIYLESAFFFEVYPLWFMRFDIVFAFYIGILLYHWRKSLVIHSPRLNIGLVGLFIVAAGLASATYVVLARPEHRELFLWLDFLVKLCSVLGCVAIMSLLVIYPGRFKQLLDWLSPFAYTLFLTHLFVYTFFSQAWVSLMGQPEFFEWGGMLYIVVMVLTAIVTAIVLKTGWDALVSRVRARA